MNLVFDIEANGLRDSATKIHCICTLDLETKEERSYYDGAGRGRTLQDAVGYLLSANLLIGHNIINYDLSLIRRLYNVPELGCYPGVYDTLVSSRLANPDRFGGHSLKMWGKRLKVYKGDFSEDAGEDVWDTFTPEMLEYCQQDVRVTEKVCNAVKEELKDFSQLSIDVEHRVAEIITQQEINGVKFDREKAHALIERIEGERTSLFNKIRPFLSMEYEIVGKPLSRIFKKDGTYHAPVAEWMQQEPSQEVLGPFTRLVWCEPDINSRNKLIKQLLRMGWKPCTFTDKGSPKLTFRNEFDEVVPVPSLEEFEFGKLIALYFVYGHRLSLVKGLSDNVREDSRISARAITNGTNTGRMQHRVIANFPRVKSFLGSEIRELLCVPEGKTMVGADLSGLELRTLANRMKDEEYTRKLLEDDIHTVNQHAAGLPTRSNAKTFIYGFLYGAGDAKIGSIVGGNSSKGKALRTKFLKELPSLDKLITQVKKASQRGYLKGLDGRKLWMRRGEDGSVKEHTALNLLLQSDGAIIFKIALIFVDKLILKRYDDVQLLISYHDEIELECNEQEDEEIGKLVIKCFEKAGTYLKMSLPITGEYKLGHNWSDVH